METIEYFKESIYFLKISELKDELNKLNLDTKGTKDILINRIITKITNTKENISDEIPYISCAKKGIKYDLTEDSLILKGAYKNDKNTRDFFKKIIGDHFHFTVFGMDFIKQRWIDGKPPTYGEFAKFWIESYKTYNGINKKTLQFNNFTRRISNEKIKLTREEMIDKWNNERNKRVLFVTKFIKDWKDSNL